MNKWNKFLDAIKNMSPERMAINRFNGSLGNFIGMIIGTGMLAYAKVWWALCFMPFVVFLNFLSLVESWQQMKAIKDTKKKLEELGIKNAM